MARLNEASFKKQIKENSFSNVYMIFGSENYLKDFYIAKLKKKLVNPAFADFNLREYEGKDVSIDDIIMDSQTVPMMSEYSLIIVHDYPLTKSKADMEKLGELFKELNESCIIVFWFESITVELKKKDSPWHGIVKTFAKAGDAVELNERTVPELISLVISSAKKRSCIIDNYAANYFIKTVGTDIQTLFNELEKLCAFVKEGRITCEIIDSVAVKSLQAKVFDISKFILAGNSDAAMSALFALFSQQEEPRFILPIIAGYYVDMYRVKSAKEAGKVPADIKEYFPYNNRDWIIDKASNDSSKISLSTLREALDILAEADLKIKSSSVNDKIILEEAVAKLLLLRTR